MAVIDRLVLDYNPFKKNCEQVSMRATLSYFGLDLIIDNKNQVHCIEINGQNSGSKGFVEAYGEDIVRKNIFQILDSFGLPVTIYVSASKKEESDQWAQEAFGVKTVNYPKLRLQLCKEAMGKPDLSDKDYCHLEALLDPDAHAAHRQAFYKLSAERMGLVSPDSSSDSISLIRNFNQAEGIIWNNTAYDLPFDEGRFIVMNSRWIEGITKKKNISGMMMFPYSVSANLHPGFSKDILEKNRKFLGESLKKYFRQGFDKVVFKPLDGSLGQGVSVFTINDIVDCNFSVRRSFLEKIDAPENYFPEDVAENLNYLKARTSGVILQPFIESKQFRSSQTGQDHLASIRYSLLAESNHSWMSFHNLGGYARLAPEPLGNSRKSQVANLATGAYAERLSERDQRKIEIWIRKAIPNFYRRALRIFHGNLDVDVINYIAVEDKRNYQQPWLWI